MKKLAACLAVLLLPGCIEFEKQTLVFRHYPETDTLVIWQHYEGIHGEDNEHDLSKKEREQLHSVVNGQRTFFFGNWITEYNAEDTGKFIAEEEARLKKGFASKPEADDARQMLAFARMVRKSVIIKNGPFYLNQQKRLSATQHVTLNNAGKITQDLNALFHMAILQSNRIFDVFGGFEEGDPNIELLEKSAHAKMEYLTLKGQQLQFRWPMTGEHFQRGMREKSTAKLVELARKGGVTIQQKDNLLIITAGKLKAADTFVCIKLPDAAFQPNATEAVSNRYGLTKGFDAARTRAKFFKDCDISYLKNSTVER